MKIENHKYIHELLVNSIVEDSFKNTNLSYKKSCKSRAFDKALLKAAREHFKYAKK